MIKKTYSIVDNGTKWRKFYSKLQVVKILRHNATTPSCMDHAITFARWHRAASRSNNGSLALQKFASPNWHLNWFVHFCMACTRHRPQNMLLLQRVSATEICYTYTLPLGWLTTICTNTHWCPHWSIIHKFFWITRLLFWHAPLGVCSTMHSAICRHQPPQRTVLGQVEARATLHITLM